MRNLWSCLLFNAVLTLPVIAHPVPAMPQSAVATSEATPACKDEKGCIKQFPNVFLRKKNVLWLKLQNGKAKTFTNDNSDGDAYRKYSAAAFYPQWNVAIIEVGYYEGGDVLVVSTSTGSSVTPLAWPHFSPNGKEFASVTSCQAYYCTDGVEIWSTAVDPPTRVYHRDPEADRWYWFGGWGNDDQLNLWVSRVAPPDDSSDDKPPKDAKRTAVVRNAQDWQLMDQK